MATLENFKLRANYLLKCFIIWFFCGFILVDSKEQALIFNADRKVFDDVPTQGPLCFTACPAKSKEEINFNKTKSVDKNSLFLKNVINPYLEHKELLAKCEHPYKPSVVFRKYVEMFQIGYEIYFDEEEHQGKGLIIYTRDQFMSVKEAKENYAPKLSRRRRIFNNTLGLIRRRSGSFDGEKSESDSENEKEVQPRRDPDETIKDTNTETRSESVTKEEAAAGIDNTKNEEKIETEKNLAKSLRIYWIGIFDFYFNLEQFNPTKIQYSADVGIDTNAAYECQGYEVDKVLYEDVDFKSIYDKHNQVEMLNGLAAFSKLADINRCGNQYGCFKQHQVIPHYYYHARASKDTTCFAVNTLPVWESISNGFLKKVDRYLYEISQILDSEVTITSGTVNILSYVSRVRSREMFMDSDKKKVPAPKIIYKMLEQVKNGEKYNLIVVTHNDPVPSKQIQHMCPPEASETLYKKVNSSWRFLINTDSETGITYPCPMLPAVLDNLGIAFRRSEAMFLNTIILEGNKTQEIEEKVDKLFK